MWRGAEAAPMTDPDNVCIVCGDVSDELICRDCHRLIGARPMKPAGEGGQEPAEEVPRRLLASRAG
jgi:hypothetical protein